MDVDARHTRDRRTIPLTVIECCAPIVEPDITPEQATTLATLFKALSDPNRVRIVNLLANAPEPVCVCDFMPVLGLSQGTVSFHLKKLLDVGLLEREQRGTWAYYSLNLEGLERLAGVLTMKEAET
ncbi:MAG: ArsR/SmtB family transcription factor [Actinomycetota bacterium]|jgi:ArsR family transcriptional regulator, arsenate/arsenite/antimonite-responsive transcriptional repressor